MESLAERAGLENGSNLQVQEQLCCHVQEDQISFLVTFSGASPVFQKQSIRKITLRGTSTSDGLTGGQTASLQLRKNTADVNTLTHRRQR
ncbi:hypothetical protein VTK26DRAFT_1430 [Humicola hyalothermophila]